ncbi:MAG: Eco57I restriction-modification methylase domain-containing protein, partial [Proteobacteria bacterium]|nr:Eco57I restriction-modification methylase domain-containing protein [Pseudomonadota bacterium]
MVSSNSSFHDFISLLCDKWNLIPAASDCLDDSKLRPFQATCSWGRIVLFHPAVPAPQNWPKLFTQIHNCVIIHLSEDLKYIDVCAQSLLDNEPIIASHLSWKNNDDLWKLGNAQNYTDFCFMLSDKFGKSYLEKKFVADFRRQTRKLAAAWTELPETFENDRHALALNTLLRLLFIAFLANRGTLDGRPHFLQEEAQKCDLANQSIYRHLIQPLFFETLNRPYHQRPQRVKKFGNIPFLNGGLFTPNTIEINAHQLDVPNAVFLEIVETLFNRYTFNAEYNPQIRHISLDPLMIGHVFESLMSRQQRSATGTFYTPMPLARQLVQATFKTYLSKACSLSAAQIEAIIQHDFTTLDAQTAAHIYKILSDITILDPAAGSGAFLQCAFEQLHGMRTALATFLNMPINQGDLARQILARNLFGVDIIPMANQLCELRLWLELIRHYPKNAEIPPLPNLDMNILCGDTLADLSQYSTLLNIPPSHTAQLPHLKRRYRLSSGKTKKKLAKQIENETRESAKTLFNALISACDKETERINTQKNLFSEMPKPTFKQTARIALLKQQKQRLQRILQDDDMLPGFSFDLHFGEILEQGGFDIIIGNPPWFSLHTLPADIRHVLKQLYRTAAPINTGKSQSPDISALFVEKSIRCTKPGGFIAMLVPNKLFHAPSYAAFRYHIQSTTHLIELKDWSHAHHNTFQAAAYPASIILEKAANKPQEPETCKSSDLIKHLPSAVPHAIFQASAPTIQEKFEIHRGICTGANHLFIGKCHSILDKDTVLFEPKRERLSERGPSPLRRYAENVQKNVSAAYAPTPDAGPCPATPHATHHSSPNPQNIGFPIESALIHPMLRGTDIRGFQSNTQYSIICTHDWTHPRQPLKNLPPLAEKWFQANKEHLSRRKISRKKPL